MTFGKLEIQSHKNYNRVMNHLITAQRSRNQKNRRTRPKPSMILCVTRRVIPDDSNFKQQLDSMSFRLGLLKLKLSNLKATVTHQK